MISLLFMKSFARYSEVKAFVVDTPRQQQNLLQKLYLFLRRCLFMYFDIISLLFSFRFDSFINDSLIASVSIEDSFGIKGEDAISLLIALKSELSTLVVKYYTNEREDTSKGTPI